VPRLILTFESRFLPDATPMNTPHKTKRGFTLMEMLLVLAIIGLVFVGSFLGMSSLNDERNLRAPLTELRSLAKRAWQRSMQEQTAWQIRFLPDRMVLEPRKAVQAEDRNMLRAADQVARRGSGVETYKIDPDIQTEVRHWGERDWHKPGPDVWVFEHSGLCEPISVRFLSAHGVLAVQFDPLTASVQLEEFSTGKE
jgi:prepilin-type N-terminal cleavage/methylation domain-containing protein